MKNDVEYLKAVLTGLVEYPEDIIIDRTVDELGVLMTASFNQKDMGNVIGREGETAKSVRTIMRHYGMKTNQERINFKILDLNQKSHYRLDRGAHSLNI